MGTIFDHRITKDEIRKLLGNSEITKEEMLSFGFSQVQHYVGIFKLYSLRKDKTEAKEYFDKIPNTITKRFTLCHHPPIFKE